MKIQHVSREEFDGIFNQLDREYLWNIIDKSQQQAEELHSYLSDVVPDYEEYLTYGYSDDRVMKLFDVAFSCYACGDSEDDLHVHLVETVCCERKLCPDCFSETHPNGLCDE